MAACLILHRNGSKFNEPCRSVYWHRGHGHTYPGATVPFGMVQLSPDNGTQGWDWCSGYHYSDSMIAGFSHTHLSGTGIGDYCDISVMPCNGLVNDTFTLYREKFSHSNEKATPGYYAVNLDNGINAALLQPKDAGFTSIHFQWSNSGYSFQPWLCN